MSLMYTEKNKIKFTSISDRYAVPRQYKAKVSMSHAALITYVVDHFQNTKKYRQKVVDALNILTYCVLENEVPSFDWKSNDPFSNMPDIPMDRVETILSTYFLEETAIEWDLGEVQELVPAKTYPNPKSSEQPPKFSPQSVDKRSQDTKRVDPKPSSKKSTGLPTPKEDLYIQAPKIPRFDYSKPWLSTTDKNDKLVIYTTLPEIPSTQNEISVTTDVSKMTDAELISLFPNRVIHTRPPFLYEPQDDMDYDEVLGCIIPIQGYSTKELRNNIIKYPHLYKLKRIMDDGTLSNFYEHIEIDGDLLPIGEVWDTLPEAKMIPKQSDFIKEYVVRRYLLEEERGIQHRYKMYGTLDPFLTLFMPLADYIANGYTDTTSVAKQCVMSRVSFKRSRNPILRRLNVDV